MRGKEAAAFGAMATIPVFLWLVGVVISLALNVGVIALLVYVVVLVLRAMGVLHA